jgi:Sec-independent protein secretion pathway component TatC
MLMGVPLLVLYEVSVIAVWLFGRKKLSYGPPEISTEESEEEN